MLSDKIKTTGYYLPEEYIQWDCSLVGEGVKSYWVTSNTNGVISIDFRDLEHANSRKFLHIALNISSSDANSRNIGKSGATLQRWVKWWQGLPTLVQIALLICFVICTSIFIKKQTVAFVEKLFYSKVSSMTSSLLLPIVQGVLFARTLSTKGSSLWSFVKAIHLTVQWQVCFMKTMIWPFFFIQFLIESSITYEEKGKRKVIKEQWYPFTESSTSSSMHIGHFLCPASLSFHC